MRKLSGLLFVFTLFILTPFVLLGCGGEKLGPVSSLSDNVNEIVENRDVLDTGIPADTLNAIARRQHIAMVKNASGMAMAGWQLYVPVPFYSQNDPSWRTHPLGFNACGNSTIGAFGCYLCCVAMHYAKWGYSNMNPKVLNDWAVGSRQHYAFASSSPPGNCGDLIRLPQAIEYPGVCRPYRIFTNPNEIYPNLAAGRPVIVKVQYQNGQQVVTHFMIIFAFDGQRYWVKDPWRDWTQQDQPLYGNFVQGIVLGVG